MLINNLQTTDWHFKLHKYFNTNIYYEIRRGDAVDECDYFWVTVGYMILASVLAMFAMVATGLVLFGATAVSSLVLFLVTPLAYLSWVNAPLTLSLYVMLSCFGIWILKTIKALETYPTWWPEKLKYKPLNITPDIPGLFARAYQSGKDKYCQKIQLKK